MVQQRRLRVEPGEGVDGVLTAELQLPVGHLVSVLVHIAKVPLMAFRLEGEAAREDIMYCCSRHL
jgi:hypothetical protein